MRIAFAARLFTSCRAAYQAGIRPGDVVKETEVGNPNGEYRNAYERSKYHSECEVLASTLPSKTIYRPSIIVGDTQTGETSCFMSLYRLVRFVATAKPE